MAEESLPPPRRCDDGSKRNPFGHDVCEYTFGHVSIAQLGGRRNDDVRGEADELEKADDEILHVELVPPDPRAC